MPSSRVRGALPAALVIVILMVLPWLVVTKTLEWLESRSQSGQDAENAS